MRKIPKKDFVHIRAVIESMRTDPFIGDRQKLKSKDNEYRRRIGNWRVFFHIDKQTRIITIMHIRKRDSRTYSK